MNFLDTKTFLIKHVKAEARWWAEYKNFQKIL